MRKRRMYLPAALRKGLERLRGLRGRQLACVGAGLALGIASQASARSVLLNGNELSRNSRGQGAAAYELTVEGVGEEVLSMELELEERAYTREEASEIYEQILEELPGHILGENPSLREVCWDLNLLSGLEEYGVDFRWQSENPDRVDSFGNVNTEGLPEQGEETALRLRMTDGAWPQEFVIPLCVKPPIAEDGKMREQEFLAFVQEEEERQRELLQTLKNKEDVTLDGKHIRLYANIGSVGDTAKVLSNDAAGIGLFRSEFLYLEKNDYPTEEEQFQAYKTVAETMAGKRVIIRTLDIGADKQASYFNMDHEENPALGYRAIRICLTREDIFKTQLRAIFRASAFGKISIMYPMIISVDEVKKIKKIVEEVKAELTSQQIAFGEVEQGIMIETPAAVMVSEALAKEVDFFSIGTNDLTQYTLAIDRQNPKLEDFYDAHHPAVLNMIRMTVENAHKAGIWAGICGELGADLELTKFFLSIGVDELSVSPGRVLSVRKNILETDVEKEREEQLKKWL